MPNELTPAWLSPVFPVFLSPHEVHVWRTSLEVEETCLHKLASLLSPDEQARAARFRFPTDRHHFIVAHAVLRILLAHYLQLQPQKILFSTNSYGKPSLSPSLSSSGLRFNLSHSHECALFAFAYQRDVGVDIEYTRKNIDYDQLARFCFSPYEQQVLLSLAGDEKHEAFYLCWTRKEAYIKARGMGLSLPLALFDVSLLPAEPPRLLASRESSLEVDRWSFHTLSPSPGYAGAIAAEGQQWLLRSWHWPSSSDEPTFS